MSKCLVLSLSSFSLPYEVCSSGVQISEDASRDGTTGKVSGK